ncbi:PspA/IM30 family protein [Paenibacillus sp. JX-17]|uniref:PspA/IM30 family protein n=1 Tax=Paenibacillus lacisoli TaxID=3064525 RepID=A0ABT9CGY1_9BACL|nr:PspA/IM30 family protein [Paenibacillus sp. JX-17]MDO7908539.1 PspA/IM30 family protein [Paenibacillus sp. JX-17]
MGILARFKDVMKANVNELLDRSDHPEKTVDEYMRSMRSDLGQVKAETAAVLAEERRTKRALDECQAEIIRLQRYAEKTVEAGRAEESLKFLDRKAQQEEKKVELKRAYDQASTNASNMKQMQNKLSSDLEQLEARRAELNGKMEQARSIRQQLDRDSSRDGVGAALDTMKEKADLALNEAEALAELRGERQEEDLDELMDRLEKEQAAKTGDTTGPDSTSKG